MLNTSMCRGLAHYPFSVVRFLTLDGRSNQFFLSKILIACSKASSDDDKPRAFDDNRQAWMNGTSQFGLVRVEEKNVIGRC